MTARRAVLLSMGLAAVVPQRALAGEPASSAVDVVAAIAPEPGSAVASAILVGSAGQLYHPAGPGRWQRRSGGGTSVDLRAAVRAAPRSDEVLAIGADTPLFRFRGGAWRAEPLSNRGPASLSATGPLPVLAVGRHIHALESGAWVRLASAASRASAAWAAGPKGLVVALADGALARFDGRRFSPLRSPLAAGDAVVILLGASPAAIYGRAESGAWIRIDRGGTAALSPAAELAGFEEHAAGLGPDGALWLAGTLPGANGARRAVLARADRNRLVTAGDVLPLTAGDRVAVLLGHPST
ncbi:MAG TPA: hypothetical protein VNO33_05370, partial [Kofleriaceae bacterium]|nr:hypothetical protein [Kofleriaceae bacterium]